MAHLSRITRRVVMCFVILPVLSAISRMVESGRIELHPFSGRPLHELRYRLAAYLGGFPDAAFTSQIRWTAFFWLTTSILPSEFIAIVHSNYLLTIAYMNKSAGYVVRVAGLEPARL